MTPESAVTYACSIGALLEALAMARKLRQEGGSLVRVQGTHAADQAWWNTKGEKLVRHIRCNRAAGQRTLIIGAASSQIPSELGMRVTRAAENLPMGAAW